jgi:S-adenosylmethionine hydrolase
VILAVVDPAVGTSQRPVAIRIDDHDACLIGPDNGLLLPAALRLGPISTAVELPRRSIGGPTFAGRDIYAPAAAKLAIGAPIGDLGVQIDPATLAGEAVPEPHSTADGRLRAEVLWVDRFGNAQLNVTPQQAGTLGSVVSVRAGGTTWTARTVTAYGDLKPDELGLVTDSYGLLALSYYGTSASQRLGLRAQSEVWLEPQGV